ncbi:hypothetical protein MSAN_02015200 [Mycena sanguinolenta]|uniref:Uncharacterized protein n=1 Tax=Mycena sanguinolenta TaxID=230812 RepID=A0A8H6XJA4_9AGAR|nr:hypothetical protein MSAN_02015200 [Mycena sanguinolenta]
MFSTFIVHKVPPHLLKTDFEGKVEALLDKALLLPIVKKNLVKCEMWTSMSALLDSRPGTLFFLSFCTARLRNSFFAILATAEVRGLFDMGKEWGLHNYSSGFSATAATKIDNPAPKGGAHLFCVYNVPRSVSSPEHDKKFVDYIENFVQVPACRKNFVRFEMWQSNNLLDEHMRAFGYSAAGPTFIHHARLESGNNMFEMMKDPAAHQSVLKAGNTGQDFDLTGNGYVFSGRVVTKFDKTG